MQLDKKDIIHLYARSEFYRPISEINFNLSLTEHVDHLFNSTKIKKIKSDYPKTSLSEFRQMTPEKRNELVKENVKKVKALSIIWLKQMMDPEHSFTEKMTLFWHGHFACNTSKNIHFSTQLLNVIRENALANFKDLLIAVANSPAMIDYLHLKQNKRKSPNEDFARELMELFTLGQGVGYTEQDIKEVARSFTGWSFDDDFNFTIKEKQQDTGIKTIFEQTKNFNGYEVIDLILEKKECATHIASKLYKFFVNESVNHEHVNEIATALYSSGYEIKEAMKVIFLSNWFYESKGKLIKSPIDLIVGLGKTFNLRFDEPSSITNSQHYLGQVLFKPPNVAGWPSGKKWIDSSRLAYRIRLGSLFINKGILEIESSPEIDAMIPKAAKKVVANYHEEIDWKKFWNQNQPSNAFEILIRCENELLEKEFSNQENLSIIQLVSTPDYQLT